MTKQTDNQETLYDFYISHVAISKENDFCFSQKNRKNQALYRFFKGKRYYACVPHGEPHGLFFPDVELVGTGTFDDVIIKTY